MGTEPAVGSRPGGLHSPAHPRRGLGWAPKTMGWRRQDGWLSEQQLCLPPCSPKKPGWGWGWGSREKSPQGCLPRIPPCWFGRAGAQGSRGHVAAPPSSPGIPALLVPASGRSVLRGLSRAQAPWPLELLAGPLVKTPEGKLWPADWPEEASLQ